MAIKDGVSNMPSCQIENTTVSLFYFLDVGDEWGTIKNGCTAQIAKESLLPPTNRLLIDNIQYF